MNRIELITAAALAAAAAFIVVPTGQAAPLSTAKPVPAIQRTTDVRPAPTVRVVYPSPYSVSTSKAAL